MPKGFDQYLYENNFELIEYLKKSRVFGHLSEDLLQKIVPLSELEEFPRNTEILSEGQKNEKVFFLVRGEVSIYQDSQLTDIMEGLKK